MQRLLPRRLLQSRPGLRHDELSQQRELDHAGQWRRYGRGGYGERGQLCDGVV